MKEVHVVLPVYRLNTESDAYAKYTPTACWWTDVASVFSIAICTGCVVPDFLYLQDVRIKCHRVVGLIVFIPDKVQMKCLCNFNSMLRPTGQQQSHLLMTWLDGIVQFESSKVKFVAIISHNNCTSLIEAAKQVLDLTFDPIVQQFDSSKIKFVAIISLEIETSGNDNISRAVLPKCTLDLWRWHGWVQSVCPFIL